MAEKVQEVLTPDEMRECDRITVLAGPADFYGLMRRAGAACADEVLRRYGDAQRVHVLCGPGNNGGDGYVVAALLSQAGCDVRLWALDRPKAGTDAALAAGDCAPAASPLDGFVPERGDVVVDALFGAGFARGLPALAQRASALCLAAGVPVVSIDLPSGIDGRSGAAGEGAFQATQTVTFARLKPGHLLQPGRSHCGLVVVADIGISDAVVQAAGGLTVVNTPALWRRHLRAPGVDAHKYSRGHVAVLSGDAAHTGAARLSALAAARVGAGAVTLLSPPAAMSENAAHLTAIMLRQAATPEEAESFCRLRKVSSIVIGPAFGVGERTRAFVATLHRLGTDEALLGGGMVVDADAITSFRDHRSFLGKIRRDPGRPEMVFTPHEGEFGRLFPEIAGDRALSKLDKARQAAALLSAVVVYKGPDTVIASPDGRAAINANGSSWLATAGSGDVLAGLIAGLLAQGVPTFEAACAAVWIHAEAGAQFGPGLIADDLPLASVPVLRALYASAG
jgi:hydroxyethylthiazole kinase-like uncharacterized protein yjeF